MLESDIFNDTLTAKELEVLKLIARGYTNKEIAKIQDVKYNTTKSQIAKIYQKFNDATGARNEFSVLRLRLALKYLELKGCLNWSGFCKLESKDKNEQVL